jgi:hypothetical protein
VCGAYIWPDYGKNTIGYDRYCAMVPRHARNRTQEHPKTPDIHGVYSKRQWEGLVKVTNDESLTPPLSLLARSALNRARSSSRHVEGW